MSTAILLPASGSPEIARYWIRNYETWRGEADQLLVFVNGDTSSAELYRDAGARVWSVGRKMGHGETLDALLSFTDADAVMLVEDDAYVREPGAIASRLERASSGEIIGSPRWGMSPELEAASVDRWGHIEGPDGSVGSGLWPCFLFARTDVLRAAGSFAGASFAAGATVPGLNHTLRENADTDTASALAFVLRDRHPITADVQHKELWQKHLPETGAPYFHAGGLSTLDQLPRPGCGGSNEGLDWAHRCFWWSRMGIDVTEHVRVGELGEQVETWGPVLAPWINWEGG